MKHEADRPANHLNHEHSFLPGSLEERNPYLLSGLIATGAIAIGAVFKLAHDEQEKAYQVDRQAVLSVLKEVRGLVAFTIDNQIHIVEVDDVAQQKADVPRLKFQIGTEAQHLLWLNDHQVIFARVDEASPHVVVKGKPDKNGKIDEYEFTANSFRIEILDIKTGVITTLIDPYNPSESFKVLFGDCKINDRALAEKKATEKKDFFEKDGGKGIRVWFNSGDIGGFVPTDIGIDSKSGDIFVKTENLWVRVEQKGDHVLVEKTTTVPDITAQLNSPNGLAKLSNEYFSGLGFHANVQSPSLVIDRNGDSPAWYIDSEKK